MAKVLSTKKTERAGVNEFRSLLESAGHIVQDIDGGNDYGEDCYLSLTEFGQRTGDIVAVQIKSGTKYRRAIGYAIPCRGHVADWSRSRIPVIGIVFDPEFQKLYWVNMTEYLHSELAKGKRPRSIPVGEDAILDATTVTGVVSEVRKFIARNDHLVPAVPDGTRKVVDKYNRYANRRANEISSTPIGGHSIPAFVKPAKFIEEHPRLLLATTVTLLSILICSVLAMAGPGLYRVAEDDNQIGWMWLVCFYGSILYLTGFSLMDRNKKRSALLRTGAYAIVLSGWYVAFSGTVWPESKALSVLVIASMPAIAKMCGLHLVSYYVIQEISRRRRLRKAYGEDSLD